MEIEVQKDDNWKIKLENEPEFRPEFIEKMKLRALEPTIRIKDFKKHFGLK